MDKAAEGGAVEELDGNGFTDLEGHVEGQKEKEGNGRKRTSINILYEALGGSNCRFPAIFELFETCAIIHCTVHTVQLFATSQPGALTCYRKVAAPVFTFFTFFTFFSFRFDKLLHVKILNECPLRYSGFSQPWVKPLMQGIIYVIVPLAVGKTSSR